MPKQKNRIQDHLEATESEPLFERCSHMAQETFEQHPIGVTLGVFAAGLGLGAMIGAALARPLGLQHQATAETLGRRVLSSISDLLPESIQRQIGC
jgi:hypothetical protein